MTAFFIPAAKDDAAAEEIWQSVKAFAERNVGRRVTDRRIRRLEFRRHDDWLVAIVGEPEPIEREIVVCILDAGDMYLICTLNRGVKSGLPALVGKRDAIDVEQFGA